MPASAPTHGVNLSSGKLVLPLTLMQAPGVYGIELNVSALYDGAAAERAAGEWNLSDPTGTLGLGWSIPRTCILRDHRGSGVLEGHEFVLMTDGASVGLVQTGESGSGAARTLEFTTCDDRFIRATYVPSLEEWTLRRTDGSRLVFGGGLREVNGQRSSEGDSVEWALRWGGWLGASAQTARREVFAIAWNLVRVVTLRERAVRFAYVQDKVRHRSGAVAYTAACLLSRIFVEGGHAVEFDYGVKMTFESAPPNTRDDVDQRRQDRAFLRGLRLLFRGRPVYEVALEYEFLRAPSERMKKRVLTRIRKTAGRSNHGVLLDLEAPTQLDYYGLKESDGVGIAEDGSGVTFRDGASYGALKSLTAPAGAVTTYKYSQNTLAGERSLTGIQPPAGAWVSPRLFFGLDYTVVAWQDANKENVALEVYQWTGQWQRTLQDRFARASRYMNFEVLVCPGYFAVVSSAGTRVYTKNRKRPLAWTIDTMAGVPINDQVEERRYAVRAEERLLAAVTRDAGGMKVRARAFRHGSWGADVETPIEGGQTFSLGASGRYACFVTARKDLSRKPRVWLWYVDRRGELRTAINGRELAEFLPNSGPGEPSGATSLQLFARNGFVAIQALAKLQIDSFDPTQGVQYVCKYRHLAFRLGDGFDLSAPDDLKTVYSMETVSIYPDLFGNSNVAIEATNTRVAIAGPASKLGFGSKHVYRYDGAAWNEAHLKMERMALFWDEDLTAAVETQAGTKHYQLHAYDPISKTWSQAIQFDSTDTEFYLFIAGVLQQLFFALSMIPFIGLPGQAALMLLDIGLAIGEGLIAQLAAVTPSGGRYVVVGDKLWWEGQDRAWHATDTISKQGGSAFRYGLLNSTDSHIVFMRTGADGARNYVALLRNGRVHRYLQLETADETKDGGRLSTEPSESQPVLWGPATVAAYPRSKAARDDFNNARSWSLYQIVADGVTGPVVDTVVSAVTVHDGFQPHYTCFRYSQKASVQSLSGAVIYAEVAVAVGGPDYASAAALGEESWSFHVLEPGLSDAALAGLPVRTTTRVAGRALQERLVEYRVFDRLAKSGGLPVARVARPSIVKETLDGVTVTTVLEYRTEGEVLAQPGLRSITRRAPGFRDELLETMQQLAYAHEFYPRLDALNLCEEVAQTLIARTVRGRTTWECVASVWQEFSGEGWYPVRTFAWIGAAAPALHGRPPERGDGSADWRLLSLISIVKEGRMRDVFDAGGTVTSALFDAAGETLLATCRNASFETQAHFCCFEPYESLERWQRADGGKLEFDRRAFVGSRSLSVRGEVEASLALLQARNDAFVAAACVFLPAEFASSAGEAVLDLVARNGNPHARIKEDVLSRDLTTLAPGQWHYLEIVADLDKMMIRTLWDPADILTLRLRIRNRRTAPILIDAVRLSPAAAEFSASCFDPDTMLAVATIGNNGEAARISYRATQPFVPDLTVDPRGEASFSSVRLCRPGERVPSAQLRVSGMLASVRQEEAGGTRFRLQAPRYALRFAFHESPRVLSGPNTQPTVCTIDFGERTMQIETDGVGARCTLSGHGASTIKDVWFAALGRIEVLVAVLAGHVHIYVCGEPTFSFDGSVKDGPLVQLRSEGPSCALEDAVVVLDPKISAVYTDALMRVRQSQRAIGDAVVALEEQLYDRGGRQLLATLTCAKGVGAAFRFLGFEPGFVQHRDPHEAAAPWLASDRSLQGLVQAWQPADRKVEVPYRGQLRESSLSERVVEVSQAHAGLKLGSPGAERRHYQRLTDLERAFLGDEVSAAARVRLETLETRSQGTGAAVCAASAVDAFGTSRRSASLDPTSRLILRHETVDLDYDVPSQAGPAAAVRFVKTRLSGARRQSEISVTDRFGRLLYHTSPDRGAWHAAYDRTGRMRFSARASDQEGAAPTVCYYEYDGLGRMTELGHLTGAWDVVKYTTLADSTTPAGKVWHVRYRYDTLLGVAAYSKGRLTEARRRYPLDPDSGDAEVVMRYAYDIAGNVIEESLECGGQKGTMRYHYDAWGRPEVAEYPTGLRLKYRHDELGRLVSVGRDEPGREACFGSFEYGAAGEMLVEQVGAADSGTRRSFSYDSVGLLRTLDDAKFFRQSLDHVAGGVPVGSPQSSEMIFKADPTRQPSPLQPQRTTYAYDLLGQLISAGGFGGVDSEGHPGRHYDLLGNRMGVKRAGKPPRAFRYEAASNRLLTEGGAAEFAYDASGNALRTPRVSEIRYDWATHRPSTFAAGRPPRKVLHDALGRAALAERSGQRTLWWHDAAGRPLCGLGPEGKSFVYGPLGLLAQSDTRGDAFFSRDHVGSTRVAFDAAGAHVFSYDAFGVPLSPSGLPPELPDRFDRLFTGQRFDRETGLYDFGARLYDPFSGRFLQPDPAAQYASPYVYAGNDPAGRVDPDGRLSFGYAMAMVGRTALTVAGGAMVGGVGNLLAHIPDLVRDGNSWWRYFLTGAATGGAAGFLISMGGVITERIGVAGGGGAYTYFLGSLHTGWLVGPVAGMVLNGANRHFISGVPLDNVGGLLEGSLDYAFAGFWLGMVTGAATASLVTTIAHRRIANPQAQHHVKGAGGVPVNITAQPPGTLGATGGTRIEGRMALERPRFNADIEIDPGADIIAVTRHERRHAGHYIHWPNYANLFEPGQAVLGSGIAVAVTEAAAYFAEEGLWGMRPARVFGSIYTHEGILLAVESTLLLGIPATYAALKRSGY